LGVQAEIFGRIYAQTSAIENPAYEHYCFYTYKAVTGKFISGHHIGPDIGPVMIGQLVMTGCL